MGKLSKKCVCISVYAFFFLLHPRVCTCEPVSLLPAVSDSGDEPGASGCRCVGVARRFELAEDATPRRAGREDEEGEEEGVCREEEEGNKGRGEVQG